MADDSLVGKFGLRRIDDRAAVDIAKKLESLLQAFLKLDKPIAETFTSYRREEILENDEFYYLPVGWIGCCGFLVLKASEAIIQFGSYMGPESHIWAFKRGANLGVTGAERRNDVVITAVRDERETLRVLRSFLNGRYVDNELEPKLRSELPVRVADVDLYFGLRDLHEAEKCAWFDFTIEPVANVGAPSSVE